MFGLFPSKQDRYAKEVRELRKELQKELDSRRRYASGRFNEFSGETRKRLGKVGDHLGEKGRYVWDYTDEAMHDFDLHVHRRPWTYIATGTAVGLITGLLIGRRY